MQKILVIGAGRSSTSLINYLLDHSTRENWKLTLAEKDVSLAQAKTNGHSNAQAVPFDVSDEATLTKIVTENDLIISMLPATLHLAVAEKCAEIGRHLLTASYLNDEIQSLSKQAIRGKQQTTDHGNGA